MPTNDEIFSRKPADDTADPEWLPILVALWAIDRETPRRHASFAKLRKQTGMPMSTLKRHLAALSAAGVLSMENREDGTGDVALTPEGAAICRQLFQP
jgi:DNA-binding MarR family transcriptional regulator